MSKEATMGKLFSLFIAILFCAPAFAGQSSADLVYGATPTTPTTTTTTAPTPPTRPTQFPTAITLPAPIQMPSINPAANQGQQSQSGGAGANAAAGAALIAAGAALMSNPPTVPAGAALIAMGMLAMAQSGHDSNAAGQSGATAAASVNGVTAANPTPGTGKIAFVNPNVTAGTNALTSAGYKVNGDGLVTPSGDVIPNSAFNSAGGMAKAGMDAATIKEVQKVLASVNDDASRAKVSGVAVGEGGGGISNDRSGGDSSTYVNPFKLNSGMKKQMVAGKTVLFDGDPIGVRGQDIFEMIHTCYEKKRSRNDFLDESSGASVRAPASLPAVHFGEDVK